MLEKVRDIDQNGFLPLEERIKKADDPNDPVSLLQSEIKRLKKDADKYEEQVLNLTEKVKYKKFLVVLLAIYIVLVYILKNILISAERI